MKSQVRWTEEEVAILKEYGAIKLLYELAEMLPNHTPMGVSVKRKRLGIELSEDYLSRQGAYGRSFVDDDNLCKADQSLTLNDLDNMTKQVILGSILGDGSIKRNGSGGRNRDKWKIRNFIFYDGHKKPQFDYTDWKASKLQTFFAKSRRDDEANVSEMWTVSHPIFTMLRDKFYPARTKCHKSIVPLDVLSHLDLFGFMIWYFDDGCLGINKQHRRPYPNPSICAKGWDLDGLTALCKDLNDRLGLSLYIRTAKHRGDINKNVVIPARNRRWLLPFWQGIAKKHGVPDCMMYKLDTHEWRKYTEEEENRWWDRWGTVKRAL